MIAGIVQDQDYFDEVVQPRLDGDRVAFIGAVGSTERSDILGRAPALLHPIDFEEPFGYSVVEAMACGTPVIAFARGSMPELIEDGVTGFLVADVEAAVAAVERVCLPRPERQFGRRRSSGSASTRMVDEYAAAYEAIVRSRSRPWICATLSRCGPWSGPPRSPHATRDTAPRLRQSGVRR